MSDDNNKPKVTPPPPPEDHEEEPEDAQYRDIEKGLYLHIEESHGIPSAETKTIHKTAEKLLIETHIKMGRCPCGRAMKTTAEIGGTCSRCHRDICCECVKKPCTRCGKSACKDHMNENGICKGHSFFSAVLYELVKS